MQLANMYEVSDWFKVLLTSKFSQAAAMTLAPGQATRENAESHEDSEQVLLLITGDLTAEIDGKSRHMKAGDVVIIPPGVKHKFTNPGEKEAVTFNVYSPPEYPPDEKG